ncbi:MAG: MarR family winged helix-turn-helix transcriptional regulator [Nitrospirales bacterium]|nr:winged helix-turn-helix transcriptional regulator [Nitrospira sp.]MDR4501837.1 MarR family winged helix-turn-helix transcriptional regulator [Nitrospirales bacterium]
MRAKEVSAILERLCNLLRMEMRAFGLKHGLQPVQLEALTYLAHCNRYSDTPQAVGEYLGLTKGTVSQSLKVLEKRQLLHKHQDREDKRVVHLSPTAWGRTLVEQSLQAKGLTSALGVTSEAGRFDLQEMLLATLRNLQRQNNRKSFAACHTCRFNELQNDRYVCGLTKEPLSRKDIQLLCREHQYEG